MAGVGLEMHFLITHAFSTDQTQLFYNFFLHVCHLLKCKNGTRLILMLLVSLAKYPDLLSFPSVGQFPSFYLEEILKLFCREIIYGECCL